MIADGWPPVRIGKPCGPTGDRHDRDAGHTAAVASPAVLNAQWGSFAGADFFTK